MSRCLPKLAQWSVVCVILAVLLLCGCQSISRWLEGEPESHRRYRSANELFEAERYDEAAVAYRAWLADYNEKADVVRPLVLYRLGESCRLRRDYEGAAAAYTTLVKLYSGSADGDVKELVELAKLRLDDIMPKTKPGSAEPGAGDK